MKLIPFLVILLALEIANGFQGVFWHVCDVHLNKSYSKSNTIYGDYNSDSSQKLVESAFQEMKKVYPNPEFIIFNGDSVYHGELNEYDFKESLKTVSNELWKQFPTSIILPSFGNHDVNPSNMYGIDSKWCGELYKIWGKFFENASETHKSFSQGCYYSRIISSNGTLVNVIVLNTMLWYSVNSLVKNIEDPFSQFAWLESNLKESAKNKTKVFIVGHVPPGASEYSPIQYRHLHPKFNVKLLNLLQDYADIIEAGFFSHQHTDSFKIIYDRNGKPKIPLFLSPSVSPYRLKGMGSVNPSVRLYFWKNIITERRFEQYHTKLHPSSLNWTLEYNSSSFMKGLSADYLNDLVSDFSKEYSVYFDKFYNYHLSGQFHDDKDCPTNSSCRCNIICGLENIDYNTLDACLKKCQKSVSQWVMIASVIIIFTLILIGVVIGANKVYCRGRRTASLTRDIYLAPFNGKNCEEIMSEHIDNIAESTFGDVPEYRGHIRNNSRTILTLNDGNEIVEKSHPSISKFALQSKNKPQEKYDYTRM